MERRFEFRAWDGEKMHYDVVPWRHDFVISLSFHRCLRSTGTGFLGSGGKEGDFQVPGIAFKELMQFTGLHDKNGKDIYEGDLCKDDRTIWRVVCWNGCFQVEDIADKTKSAIDLNADYLWNYSSASEVIGNIHEHAHLLSGRPEEGREG